MRRVGALGLVAVLTVACAAEPSLTAHDAIDEFTAAGLDAPDPRDVTDSVCTDIGCEEAVATDVVTVFRWEDSTQALAHSADVKQPAYSLNEFVITFPVETDVDPSEYAAVLRDAVVRRRRS